MRADVNLPAGWTHTTLGDVAQVRTGLALGRPATADPVTLPYLRVANVQDGYFDLEEVKEVTIAQSEVGRYSLANGDLLLTEGGDFDKLGRGCVWRGEISNCLHQNHVFAVRANRERVDPNFLACATSSRLGRLYFLRCAKKSTNLASINSSQLRGMPVLLPPLDEQVAIYKRVAAWDAAIRTLVRLICAKERLKQELAAGLLCGRIRFPGTQPNDWPVRRVRDVTTQSALRNSQGLGVNSVMAVNKAQGMIPMRERTIGASLDRYKVVRRDWFAYNPMRLNIGSLARWNKDADALVSPDYVVFSCQLDQIDPDYFDHFRRSILWERFVTSAGNGSVRVRIYYDDLGSLTLKQPPLTVQKRIARVLTAAGRELCLLGSQIAALRRQRQGVIDDLLTGQRRVKGAAA
jgi:type I restriction enzyme S subunit